MRVEAITNGTESGSQKILTMNLFSGHVGFQQFCGTGKDRDKFTCGLYHYPPALCSETKLVELSETKLATVYLNTPFN